MFVYKWLLHLNYTYVTSLTSPVNADYFRNGVGTGIFDACEINTETSITIVLYDCPP